MKPRLSIRILSALLLLACAQAHAQGLTASASPPQAALSLAGTQTLRVQWDLATIRPGITPTTSTEGRLVDRATGNLLATIPVPLSGTAPGRSIETVHIDRERLRDAIERGTSSIAYERTWDDGLGGNSTAQVLLMITGSGYGALQVRDVRLRYADGSDQNRVVDEGSKVSAYAEVSFSGRGGMLEYEWLLADPSSTRSEPVFFRLAQSRMPLSGVSPLKISAPALPTQRSGPHILQLRIREPNDVSLQPTLAYYVRPSGDGVAALGLLAPPAGASLGAKGAFQWDAVKDATSYQLEIYDELRDERLTGVLLPAHAGTQATPLTDIARARLPQGCRCRWRVLAFDAAGELRGASELRPIVIPPQKRGKP